MDSSYVVVTGAAGYIGSHVVLELSRLGYKIVMVDFSDRLVDVWNQINTVVENADIKYEMLHVRDIASVFKTYTVSSVIHLAGYKSVQESVENPLKYYSNNVSEFIVLLEVMEKYHCKRLIVSSTASVYGKEQPSPISEKGQLKPYNPYGRSKLMMEDICNDLDNSWKIIMLRYFNPIGCDATGSLSEDRNSTNIMPRLMTAASNSNEIFRLMGNDYCTPDGTCIRDYVHVSDIAGGHGAALNALNQYRGPINLGLGCGVSVLELIRHVEVVTGKTINVRISPRRSGDIAEYYADVTLAKLILEWSPKYSIEMACRDAWNAWITRC